MEEVVDENLIAVKDGAKGSRKRRKHGSVREQAKRERHRASMKSKVFIGCKHNTSRFSCSKIRPGDALFIRQKLSECANKVGQDNKVAGWFSVSDVKRKTRDVHHEKIWAKPHTLKVKYRVPTNSGLTVSVCKKFFMHLTCLKNNRINNICKLLKKGECVKERRGGDRIGHKSANKKGMVREFIGNLKGSESHYNRKKSARIYLHSELTQNKLRAIYNDSVAPENQVSRTMFQIIFSEFNIGFKSPASDACTYCSKLSLQIKNEKDIARRSTLQIEKRVHKVRASAFYKLLREPDDDDTITYCFDLQQVQPLPKTPIQQAFYARQISFYNFCIVAYSSKEPFFTYGQKTKQVEDQWKFLRPYWIFLRKISYPPIRKI